MSKLEIQRLQRKVDETNEKKEKIKLLKKITELKKESCIAKH